MTDDMDNYLQNRNGTWRFRMRVPKDLVEAYGQQEIIESLRTKDKKEAQRLLRHKLAEVQTSFDELRSPTVQKPQEGPGPSAIQAATEVVRYTLGDKHPVQVPLLDERINELALDYAQDLLEVDDRWRSSGSAPADWVVNWRKILQDIEGPLKLAYSHGQANSIVKTSVDEILAKSGLVASKRQMPMLAQAVAKTYLCAVQTVLRRFEGDIIETEGTIGALARSLNVKTE